MGKEIFQLDDIEEANMLGGIIFLSQAFADLDYSENISPKEYKLHPNYPNPFNPVTTVRFDGANPADLTTLRFMIYLEEILQLSLVINYKQVGMKPSGTQLDLLVGFTLLSLFLVHLGKLRK